MNRKGAEERIIHLREVINHHRYLQHVEDRQEISYEALDSLKKELFDLEAQYPDLITPDSPTQRIGGKPLEKFKKARHETPMLSLNDAFSEDDMRAWLKRLENHLGYTINPEFYCELKIDGLAVELRYENGILVEGSTRGDGVIGEDVTQNLKTIGAIPLRLNGKDLPRHLIVRGEVFLTKKEFARINKELIEQGEKPYTNPRNLAAGTIRQLDSKIVASRKLDSFQYDIIHETFARHSEEHKQLREWGCKVNPHNKECHSLEEVFAFQKYWEQHRDLLPYEIDGVVVVVNSNEEFNAAGSIGKTPRAAIAYKFSAKETTTIVYDIKLQVGRTGTLTPIAIVRPVVVSGVTISKATLHNYDEIGRLGLKIGDTVIISRAGDVIPQIVKVLPELRTGKEKDFHMPKQCPADGGVIIKENVYYRCSNKDCGAIVRRGLFHFVSRGALNIEGLGPKIIDRFLDEGLISDAADIFKLQKRDIEVLERFGEKSAENIVREIQQKKHVSLPRFIYALGILHIGEETARLLADAVSSSNSTNLKLMDIVKMFQKMTQEDLQNIPDIGPIVAESIYEWFKEEKNIHFIKRLSAAGVTIEISKTKKASGLALSGMSFVLTGSLTSMTREQAKEKIRALGGEVHESVSSKTNFVVMGNDPGSKAERARALGVRVVGEKNFLKMIEK